MKEFENVIPRPDSFDNYICNKIVKDRIIDHIVAAKMKGVLPPHVLLSGPPGTGKTTMVNIIAKILKVPVIKFVGVELRKISQLYKLLEIPAYGAILFLDEIHAISKDMMEILYPIMEDGEIPGIGDKSLRIYLNPLMVIGATTEPGTLEKPLIDRFIIKIRIPIYTDDQMLAIVTTMAAKMTKIPWDIDALKLIAGSSKNTPRIAGTLLFQISDSALANSIKTINLSYAKKGLKRLSIDSNGLDETDRQILKVLKKQKVLGASALAAILNVDEDWIVNVEEPYLLRKGYIIRTPHGRQITAEGLAKIA